MKKLLVGLCFILGCLPMKIHIPEYTDQVKMVDFAFEPKIIKIKAGTTVTWTNEVETPHNVVISFEGVSPFVTKGSSWSHTFNTVGSFDYYCAPHQSMGMNGRVIVE